MKSNGITVNLYGDNFRNNSIAYNIDIKTGERIYPNPIPTFKFSDKKTKCSLTQNILNIMETYTKKQAIENECYMVRISDKSNRYEPTMCHFNYDENDLAFYFTDGGHLLVDSAFDFVIIPQPKRGLKDLTQDECIEIAKIINPNVNWKFIPAKWDGFNLVDVESPNGEHKNIVQISYNTVKAIFREFDADLYEINISDRTVYKIILYLQFINVEI